MTAQELKNSILQLAVQGKLVSQCKDDEPASELLKRIDQEKSALIKAGKIKKYKELSELSVDDCSFDIPESWILVKLGYICQFLDGVKIREKEYPYLEAKYLRGKTDATILNEGKFVEKGTRLILVDGENSGEVFNATEDGYMGSTFKVLFFPQALLEGYLLYFLLLKKSAFRNNKTGSAIPHLNKELFFNMPFPIPPLAEQKRIVEKIEELMPLIEEYGEAEEQLDKLNAEFPDKLRKSILQQAVQGKLTERDPADEPASELLKRIKSEKEALIKSGKIKKEKPLPPISEDEKPFDIPDTWVWVRLGELFDISTGMTPLKGERKFYEDGSIPWVTSSLTSQRYIQNADTFITEYALSQTTLQLYPVHTLIIAMYGQGKTRGQISELCIPATINQACAALMQIVQEQDLNNYIYYYFLFYYDSLRRMAEGSSQPNLNLDKIRNSIVPLPPLAEQKRIVKRVEELLALCDELK